MHEQRLCPFAAPTASTLEPREVEAARWSRTKGRPGYARAIIVVAGLATVVLIEALAYLSAVTGR